MDKESNPYIRVLKQAQALEQKVFNKKHKVLRGGKKGGLAALVRKNDLELKIYADEFNKRKKLEEDKAEELRLSILKQAEGKNKLDAFLKDIDERKKTRAKELRDKSKKTLSLNLTEPARVPAPAPVPPPAPAKPRFRQITTTLSAPAPAPAPAKRKLRLKKD